MTAMASRKIDFAATLESIDGMKYRHDGLNGVIRVTRLNGMTRIEHHPTSAAKRTKAYRSRKSELKDDWFTSWDGECPAEFWVAVEHNGRIRYEGDTDNECGCGGLFEHVGLYSGRNFFSCNACHNVRSIAHC